MADEIIKNPVRAVPQTQKRYTPEYVRLNKEPVVSVAPTTLPVPDELFASIDGVPFDDDGDEIRVENGHIIDNNDYVDFGPYNAPKAPKMPEPTAEVQNALSPVVGDYILMVFGKLVESGSLNKVESKIKAILYGEDSDFADLNVSTDDIVVLKRIAIKVGVFIDD